MLFFYVNFRLFYHISIMALLIHLHFGSLRQCLMIELYLTCNPIENVFYYGRINWCNCQKVVKRLLNPQKMIDSNFMYWLVSSLIIIVFYLMIRRCVFIISVEMLTNLLTAQCIYTKQKDPPDRPQSVLFRDILDI